MKIEMAISLVLLEYNKATRAFNEFKNTHHGCSIIREEFDELWDEVKKNSRDRSKDAMIEEAKQVASSALRFLIDLC